MDELELSPTGESIFGRPGRRSSRRQPGARGFTLVELLIVVAIIGVLAALALVGYRKYLLGAQAGEASAVGQSIRAAEEVQRAETLFYRSCSASLTSYYPVLVPNDKKHHFINPNHAEWPCWRRLNVVADNPVRFGYAVVAGVGPTMPDLNSLANPPAVWPPLLAAGDPWFIVQAAADRDTDGVQALFVTTSLGGEVYFENDIE